MSVPHSYFSDPSDFTFHFPTGIFAALLNNLGECITGKGSAMKPFPSLRCGFMYSRVEEKLDLSPDVTTWHQHTTCRDPADGSDLQTKRPLSVHLTETEYNNGDALGPSHLPFLSEVPANFAHRMENNHDAHTPAT